MVIMLPLEKKKKKKKWKLKKKSQFTDVWISLFL